MYFFLLVLNNTCERRSDAYLRYFCVFGIIERFPSDKNAHAILFHCLDGLPGDLRPGASTHTCADLRFLFRLAGWSNRQARRITHTLQPAISCRLFNRNWQASLIVDGRPKTIYSILSMCPSNHWRYFRCLRQSLFTICIYFEKASRESNELVFSAGYLSRSFRHSFDVVNP